ncbi:valine--tRNA ligase [Candidatus Curtissbacteria bacterium]|nr:valine--tRNA ligase [Candidatus Curtissbacteria bacterium]
MNFADEKEVYNFWEEEKFFSADPGSAMKPYSLLIPPPNLTGELHLGHAMQHSILDAIARFKRLQGFDVLLLPGVDHAGIQFEATFNKYLEKQGLSKFKMTREEWLGKAWEFKEDIYKKVSDSWRFMGLSADWSREVFTLDEGPKQAVFHEFKTYFEKELIYKGPYIVQWCPKDNTAIEDAEIEYEERDDKLYFIKYPLVGEKNNYVKIATVRPETMFADVAVTVNPKDKRYKDLIGKEVLVPFVNRKVPIIADETVDIKFGSGAVKCDPAHDLDDFRRAKEHNLEIMAAVGKDGKLTELAGEFAGLKTGEAREKIREELDKQGLIEKVEDIKHTVPVCERCKTVTQLLISDEWFVKVGDIAKEAIKAINAKEVKFLPPGFAKILGEWLGNIHDWCISRSLWWGHRIPVWYRGDEKKVSLESPGEGWVQDEQVLDTWFSSGLWPLSTLGWPKDTNEFKRYFPWDFEISAPEIKFLWIARMIMISKYFTEKSPFKTMFFHGMLRDLEGRKFSKSLGNGIEPTYLIDKWGVDATRMALYSYSIPGRDGRVSKNIFDERGKNYRNFGTKIRNITKFILELKPEQSRKEKDLSHPEDNEIMDQLGKLIASVTKHLEELELHLATDEIYEFVWHKFADVYIEKSKTRREEAQPILEHVLWQVTILLHPFMPFLTEEIYQKFEGHKKSIMVEQWPTV